MVVRGIKAEPTGIESRGEGPQGRYIADYGGSRTKHQHGPCSGPHICGNVKQVIRAIKRAKAYSRSHGSSSAGDDSGSGATFAGIIKQGDSWWAIIADDG